MEMTGEDKVRFNEQGSVVQAQKIRSLLESYYASDDSQDARGSPQHDHPVESSPDTAEQEEQEDVDECLSRLVKELRLEQLLEKEKEIATEAGNTDIELRNVVYDSYSNFIAASDTVKDLGVALRGVDETLQSLDALVTSVVSQSEGIDDTLREQQDVLLEMNRTRSLLRALASLFKVPRMMKVALERNAHDIVVDLYAGSKPVLIKYTSGDQYHVGLKELLDEMEGYRTECAEALRGTLMDRGLSDGDVVVMLARLDEPTDSLAGIFLASQSSKIQSEIESLGQVVRSCEKDAVSRLVSESLEMRLMPVMMDTIRLSESIFDESVRPDVVQFVQNSVQLIVEVVQEFLQGSMLSTMAAAGGYDVDGIELEHAMSPEDVLNGDDALQIQPLYTSIDSLRRFLLDVDAAMPEATPVNMLLPVVDGLLSTHLRAAFAIVGARAFKSLKEMMMKILLHSNSGDDAKSYRFLKMEIKSIEVQIRQDFGIIRSCAMTWIIQEWIKEEWIHVVLSYLENTWTDLAVFLCKRVQEILSEETSGLDDVAFVQGFIETQFSVPRSVQVGSIPVANLSSASVLCRIYGCLRDRTNDLYKGIVLVSKHHEEPLSPQQTMLVQSSSFHTAIETIIERYDRQIKNIILSPFVDGESTAMKWLFDGNATTKLSGPSNCAKKTVQTLVGIQADYQNTGIEQIEETMDIKTCEEFIWELLNVVVEAQRAAIVARPHDKLPKVAFQQIQVDCHHVKLQMMEYLKDDKKLSSMMDSLSITAAEFCSEPVLLDPMTLDKLAAM